MDDSCNGGRSKAASKSFQITIKPAVQAVRDSAAISVSGMPSCLTPGQVVTIPVTVTNTGNKTWYPAEACSDGVTPGSAPGAATDCRHRLGYFINQSIKGDRTDLAGPIGPNASATITATFCAADTSNTRDCTKPGNTPLQPGTYTIDWQMLHEWVGWLPDKKSYSFEVKESCGVQPLWNRTPARPRRLKVQ